MSGTPEDPLQGLSRNSGVGSLEGIAGGVLSRHGGPSQKRLNGIARPAGLAKSPQQSDTNNMPRVARLQSSVGVRPFRPVRGDMILDRTMSGGVIRENRARAAQTFPPPPG
ncbi:hypothetical protein G6F65_023233 [Rhizopus arrhizus]|nr:hypothetical protein G6F65_023233 [Rhizopus arrhizus]